MPQHPNQASEPTGLPIVEKCKQKVMQQSDKDKQSAIAICVRVLKKSGRIKKMDGKWVQQKAKKKSGNRQRQR